MKKGCLHPKSLTVAKQIETNKQKLQRQLDDLLTCSFVCKQAQRLLLPEARQQSAKDHPSAQQP